MDKLRKMSFCFLLIPAIGGVGIPEVATAVAAVPDLGSNIVWEVRERVSWRPADGLLREARIGWQA
jgi:hypothetical protein